MYDAALSDALAQFMLCPLHWLGLSYSVQQLDYLTCGDEQLMRRVQVFPYEAHRQPKRGTQISYEGGDAYSDPTLLPDHLCAQIHLCVVPLAAAGTPTLEQLVLGDFHRKRRGQFDDLTAQGKLRVLEGVAAGGTLL